MLGHRAPRPLREDSASWYSPPRVAGARWEPKVCAQVLGDVRQREMPAKVRWVVWSPSRACPLAWPRAHGRSARSRTGLCSRWWDGGASPGQWLLQTPECLMPHSPALWLVVTRAPTREVDQAPPLPGHGLPAPESLPLRSPSLFHFSLRLHNCLENYFFLEHSFPQSPGAGRSQAAARGPGW